MSDRLSKRFAQCRAEGRAALVTFVTGGDPTPARTGEVLDALVAGGADVIELGLPFTDPMADGPAIQEANLRALAANTKTDDLFRIVTEFRARHADVPLIMMGYFNTIDQRGVEHFAAEAKQAGVDGVICVDIPPEEDDVLGPQLRAEGLHLIRLATPTSDDARLPAILNGASGFLYYVAVAGITGTRSAGEAEVTSAVARLKAATDLPVAVGFGVRTPEQAANIAKVADGVVVGSAIVELVGKAAAAPDLGAQVQSLVAGLSAAVRTARKKEAA